jgi:hypothetical protein
MHHPFRHRKPLSGCELDRPALQVNHEAPLDHVEELILLVVLSQWNSPCMTPSRTTQSFTRHSVWLYQESLQASTTVP